MSAGQFFIPPAIGNGSPDPFPALLHGGVRQPHDRDRGEAGGDVDLDLDQLAI